LTLSAVGEHLRDRGHNLEESKAALIAREENNFRRRIRDALEILCQSLMLNRDRRFELPAPYMEFWYVTCFTQARVTNRFPPHSLEEDAVTAVESL